MKRRIDTPPGDPLIVSVVVNYRGIEPTLACVESLLAVAYPNHRVVVVDNASPGLEAKTIQAAFGDRLEVIVSTVNLGYGGAANLGIRRALELGAAYVWVLNNDTIIDPSVPGKLIEAMEADPCLGCVTPQISAPDGPEAPNGVWFSGGTVDLARGSTRHSTKPAPDGSGVVPTGYVAGCAMFLRCGALESVGLFWEPFFLFWEDTDLSLRLGRAGWGLGVVADAWIRHEVHGSVSSPVVAYYHYRNAMLVARRHGRSLTAFTAFASLTAVIGRSWAAAMLRRRPAPTADTRGLLAGAAKSLRTGAVESTVGVVWPASSSSQPRC